MQLKSKLADLLFEKQSSESYKKHIVLVNGRGKVAEIITEWNKKQVEFTKQGLQIRRDSYCLSGQWEK